MTQDDARRLMAGYATGSLSEAEKEALFQAALEDQGLFDELAGEQALKEVLDEPGARQRLLAALEPRKHRAWLWGWAGAAATLAIVIGIVVSQRTPPPPPQQIAQVLKSPEPVAAPAPPPQPAPVKRKAAPAVSEEPPAQLRKEALADQGQEVKPQAAGGVREFAAAARLASPFSFSYALGADRSLEIVPAAAGFLAVTAGDAVVFPVNSVSAGMPVRMQIPPGANSVVVAFSATQGITGTPVRRDELSGTVTDQDPPNGRIAIQLSLTPATR